MTQQQNLEQLLAELGILYRKREAASLSYASEEGLVNVAEWDVSIDVPEGIGLPGFVASFYFDANETFLAHRIWKAQ
ncbi:MAG: hypothetical protein HY858_10420 [Candidatus Solibacter usitatus]|nr:hypothetical protein [Candidatus Solibacter usitatus]